MKKSEIVFYEVGGAVDKIDIDPEPFTITILKLIYIIKSEISKNKIEQFIIKFPCGEILINEDGVKRIKNIFSDDLFGGVNKLDVYDDGDDTDVYDDTEFVWKRLD